MPSQTYGRKGVVINDYGSLDSHKTSLCEYRMERQRCHVGTYFVVVPFIFRILVRYETFITRAQGPVDVIAKEEI